jgi:hypothetical protein
MLAIAKTARPAIQTIWRDFEFCGMGFTAVFVAVRQIFVKLAHSRRTSIYDTARPHYSWEEATKIQGCKAKYLANLRLQA